MHPSILLSPDQLAPIWGPTYPDFPYLMTRIIAAYYHIIPLSHTLGEGRMIELAREQCRCNQLRTCLVLGPRTGVYFEPDGSEQAENRIPLGGILDSGKLQPSALLESMAWWPEKQERLAAFVAAQEAFTITGYLLGDLTKGGRDATPEERERLAGRNAQGVPRGLWRCSVCTQWKGQCLDPSPRFAGKVMTVACACDNRNRCARCFQLFSRACLNANYYSEADDGIWHVPGFVACDHRCWGKVRSDRDI